MNRPIHRLILVAGAIVLFAGCNPFKSEFETGPVNLRFSADTVYFDTLLTTVASTTRRLRIYNDEPKVVTINSLFISNTSGAFSIIVNGLQSSQFTNIDLLAGDSLLVLLQANLPEGNQALPFVVEELLSVSTNNNNQEVPVVAWGQDAHFLRDSVLLCNAVWEPGKPYVIYDNILVDSLCTLTLQPGTRVYSHNGSSIFVKGTLHANGTATAPVLLTNDRFDAGFDNAPGQWSGLVFLEGSHQNQLQFTSIRNSENAIWLGTPDTDTIPDLILENCKIENTLGSGILAFTSDLSVTNCLINNCVEFTLAGLAGGNYQIKHTTLANFGFGFFRTQPVLVFTNSLQLNDGTVLLEDLKAQVLNSIVWGNTDEEIQWAANPNKVFEATFVNNLLKSNLQEVADGNTINQDPLFIEPTNYNYNIDSLSPAKDSPLNLGILIDLDSLPRDIKPDRGAYEWKQN